MLSIEQKRTLSNDCISNNAANEAFSILELAKKIFELCGKETQQRLLLTSREFTDSFWISVQAENGTIRKSRHLEKLFSYSPSLRQLTTNHIEQPAQSLGFIVENFTTLTSLTFNCWVTEQPPQLDPNLYHPKYLQRLAGSLRPDDPKVDAIHKSLSKLNNLRKLHLSTSNSFVRSIPDLCLELTNLVELHLPHVTCFSKPSEFDTLTTFHNYLQKMTQIEELELSRYGERFVPSYIFDRLATLPRLRKLDIDFLGTDCKSLKKLTQVQELSLSISNSPDLLPSIQCLTNLRVLSLRSESLVSLSQEERMTFLSLVNLESLSIYSSVKNTNEIAQTLFGSLPNFRFLIMKIECFRRDPENPSTFQRYMTGDPDTVFSFWDRKGLDYR